MAIRSFRGLRRPARAMRGLQHSSWVPGNSAASSQGAARACPCDGDGRKRRCVRRAGMTKTALLVAGALVAGTHAAHAAATVKYAVGFADDSGGSYHLRSDYSF